jgi:hypothetical protein
MFMFKYYLYSVKYYAVAGVTEVLPAGENSIPFSMMLPNHIPSSFEGEYGYVRYTVKATIDRRWKFDLEVKAAFTVLLSFDLNLDPHNRVSIEYVSSVIVWTSGGQTLN